MTVLKRNMKVVVGTAYEPKKNETIYTSSAQPLSYNLKFHLMHRLQSLEGQFFFSASFNSLLR